MDQGNTAFLLLAAALVLLMTPGLAFFYGGLVKAKSVISMMMMSFGAIGLIGVLWAIYGYAIAFPTVTGTAASPVLFDGSNWLLGAAVADAAEPAAGYPALAFVAFQATFAIITVALISGAIADRAKFGSWLIFAGVWATVVYFPVASWVFNFGLADGSNGRGGLQLRRLAHQRYGGRVRYRSDRLRRWHCGPHQRRRRGSCTCARPRKSRRVPEGHARAAQPAVRAARRRSAVVRLVRLQRGLRARC